MSASVTPCTMTENSPCSERIAARAAALEPASIRSADGLGLCQVELVVEKRALREFPRQRAARAKLHRARDQRFDDEGPPCPCSSSTCSPV